MSSLELASLMQILSVAIQKLNSAEIEMILSKTATIQVSVSPLSEVSKENSAKVNQISVFDSSGILRELDLAATREDGFEKLKPLNKIQLLALAKDASIAIDSSANKEKIIEKIVERKIGLKLRQDAFSQVMRAA